MASMHFSISASVLTSSPPTAPPTPLNSISSLSHLSSSPILDTATPVPLSSSPPLTATSPSSYLLLHTTTSVFCLYLDCEHRPRPAVPIFEESLLSASSPSHKSNSPPPTIVQTLPFPQNQTSPTCVLLTTTGYYVLDSSGERCLSSFAYDSPTPTGFTLAHPDDRASLLNQLTSYIHHADGSIAALCPVLFDSMTISSSALISLTQTLNDELSSLPLPPTDSASDPDAAASARFRQLRASLRFLTDAFGTLPPDPPPFLSSSATGFELGPSATMWPVKQQLDLYLPASPPLTQATLCALPPLPTLPLPTLALAHQDGLTTFLVNATPAGMRFALESALDGEALSMNAANTIVPFTSVHYDQKTAANPNPKEPPAVLPDPLDPSRVLVGTPGGVHSITLDREELIYQHFNLPPPPSRPPSLPAPLPPSAYSILTATPPSLPVSLCVDADVRKGRVLTVALSDGKFEHLNLTTLKYLHEAALAAPVRTPASTDPQLESLKTIPPFVDVATPLLAQVGTALTGAGRLVGGRTPLPQTNAASIAMLLATKKTLEKSVVKPLNELSARVTNREKLHLDMHEAQMKQLVTLNTLIAQLKGKAAASTRREAALRANEEVLEQRASR